MGQVVIGTHDGRFHADEALAIALLKRHPSLNGHDIQIKRSRRPEDWLFCDYLVDVGGKYDHQMHFYDHHQASFNTFFSPNHTTTLLSSAGLVYLHYGKEVIKSEFPNVDETTIDLLFVKLYDNFIETFDAVDNGVERFDGEPKYAKPYDIFSMVGELNPEWNEESLSDEQLLGRFMQAVEMVGKAFDSQLNYYGRSWLEARQVVIDSIQSLDEELKACKTLKLIKNCPWKEHLFELEKQFSVHFLYTIYKDQSGESWRIQAVPVRPDSFESRKGLPEVWRGIRDSSLDTLIGAGSGAVFVHKTGFIGGHKNYDGILRMAQLAVSTTNE